MGGQAPETAPKVAIILKLREGAVPDPGDTLEALRAALDEHGGPLPTFGAAGVGLGAALASLTSLGQVHLGAGLDIDPAELRTLVERARQITPTYHPPRFETFFRIDVTAQEQGPGALALRQAATQWVRALLQHPLASLVVETAYVASRGEGPAVNFENDRVKDPYQARSYAEGGQQYLASAPTGIGIEAAWALRGGGGEGQRFLDIERGWLLGHQDLHDHFAGAGVLFGTIYDEIAHGTNVLGVTCARDNEVGIIGVAPHVAWVRCGSYVSPSGTENIPDAIVKAAAILADGHFGGVLLIEIHLEDIEDHPLMPAETELLSYEAIRLATALGVVVVEAAGNGGEDLDAYVDPSTGEKIFAPGSSRQSGAILVGATSHGDRTPLYNQGTRIDCFSWGQNADTCHTSWDAGAGTYLLDRYRDDFGGTSAASAVIAGAALSVQGVAEQALGYRLSPPQVRALLRDRTPGVHTPSKGGATDTVGVMPDLASIVPVLAAGALPDVFVRDFEGDVGDPHDGPIAGSPDVGVVRAGPGSSAGSAFSGGSPATRLTPGENHEVYVRAWNRGGVTAEATTARVFVSEAATLPHSIWTELGTSDPAPVETSGPTILGPIGWAAADVPTSGHHCLVAIVSDAKDLGPEPADFQGDWDLFRAFIRSNNNVTWRNLNLVPIAPEAIEWDDLRRYTPITFLAPGSPDRRLAMALSFHARLPAGSRVLLVGPVDVIASMYPIDRHQPQASHARIHDGRACIPISAHGRSRLRPWVFPATKGDPRAALRLELFVHVPDGARGTYELEVRQAWRDEDVGRIVWRIHADAPPRA